MARNAIESDFRSSKMVAGGHFVTKIPKKIKLRIDLKWREKRAKVIFGHPKLKKIKVAYWFAMTRNAIKSDFWSSKMWKKKKSCIWRICVRFGMSTLFNNTSSWCLYRVNTALQLQRDLLLPQFIQYFLPPHMGVMLSLAPQVQFHHSLKQCIKS